MASTATTHGTSTYPAASTTRSSASISAVDIMDGHELTTNSAESDPCSMVNWGFVAAKPSEYLIVYRRGKLRAGVSGQGARCFKLPSDTIAIVPTTLKEVVFKATQITADNVDVRLRGVVVYRISEPLKIYKHINFSYLQHAEAKLARMIGDMCRSTTKWLVANMGVAECIRRRKEEIAASLKRELASVVSSTGDEGWGVEVVTIDIQDIYIQDSDLFTSLQAKFKTEKHREAKLAEIEASREVEKRTLESQSALASEQHTLAMKQAQMNAARALADVELAKAQDQEKAKVERFRAEHAEALARLKTQEELERQRLKSEADFAKTRLQTDSWKAQAEEEVRQLKARIDTENGAGPAALQRTFVEKALPAIAQSVASSMSNMRLSVIQGGGEGGGGVSLFHLVLQGVMEVLERYVERREADEE